MTPTGGLTIVHQQIVGTINTSKRAVMRLLNFVALFLLSVGSSSTGYADDTATGREELAQLHEARRLTAVGDVAAALERLSSLSFDEVHCVRGEALLKRGYENSDRDSFVIALESYNACLEVNRRAGDAHLSATAAFGVVRSFIALGDYAASLRALDSITGRESARFPPNTLRLMRQALEARIQRDESAEVEPSTQTSGQSPQHSRKRHRAPDHFHFYGLNPGSL